MLELVSILLAASLPPSPRPQEPAGPRAELRTHLALGARSLDGPTRVKLALSSGARTLWTHDGTGDFEHEPQTGLEVELREGELALELGAPPQAPLPPEVLERSTPMALHLWVEVDGRFLRLQDLLPVGAPVEMGQAGGHGLVRSIEAQEGREEAERRESRGESDGPRTPEERLRWRRQQRLDDNGEIPADALVRAKRHLDAMPLPPSGDGQAKSAGLWSWTWLGPGNVGGRARSILVHPTKPERMWLGTAGGGIWTTSNGGSSWAPVDDFLPSLAVSSLAMKPGDPSVLYAGTGEGFGNQDALPGAGVFKSTDGGATWAQLPATDPATQGGSWKYVNRLAVVPSKPQWLFACTKSGGIHRSTDGGATFSNLFHPGSDAFDIKVHPVFDDLVIIGTNNRVYLSSSGGDKNTWVDQSTGALNKLPVDGGRWELAFGGTAAPWIYASAERNGGEIWVSKDGGATWSLKSTGTDYLASQGWYNNTIWVDPTNVSRILVGGINLWRSTNQGATLEKISAWSQYHLGFSAHADQHAIVSHPAYDGSSNRQVYFANDGGIQTAGDVWTVQPTSGWTNLANNLGVTQFYGAAAAPDGQVLIGGSQDNDTLRYTSTAGPQAWFQAKTGDGGYCAIDYLDPGTLYGEYIHLQIDKSTNGGFTYSPATNGLGDAGDCCGALFIAPFAMDPNDPSRLVAGGRSIWRSTDRAASWGSIRGPVTHGSWSSAKCKPACSDAQNPRASAVAVARGNSDIIWVGYEWGLVSRTLDGGATWDDFDLGLPDRYVTDIAVHPSDPKQVLVTFGGYQQGSIWYTPDGGTTWADRTGTAPYELPPVQLNAVVFHPANPDWIYVGTDLGVLASEDLGVTWSKLPTYPDAGHEGPVNTEVSDLVWQGGRYLVAATHGRGMYRAKPFDVLYVDKAYTGVEKGTLEQPYKTVAAATAAAPTDCVISIRGGTYTEAPLLLDRSSELRASGGVLIR